MHSGVGPAAALYETIFVGSYMDPLFERLAALEMVVWIQRCQGVMLSWPLSSEALMRAPGQQGA